MEIKTKLQLLRSQQSCKFTERIKGIRSITTLLLSCSHSLVPSLVTPGAQTSLQNHSFSTATHSFLVSNTEMMVPSQLMSRLHFRDFPGGQWLRLCAPNAGVPGSLPGQKSRSYMPQLRRVQTLQLRAPACCN